MPKVVGISEDDLQLIKAEHTRMGSSDPRAPYSNLGEVAVFFPTAGAEGVFLRDMNIAAEAVNEVDNNAGLYAQNFHEDWEFKACLEKAGYEIVPVSVRG